ncbi:pseudouridine synthase [Chitinimonas sp. BJYL2]|uniref:pseudouridine synthase n=1 Tax=Chitinimonas sp. BJYL2 TaxID=2976696 RepID=UPI0022B5E03A|nr:pseudouridine synthase [Chitinimonas sp. BJYL2]
MPDLILFNKPYGVITQFSAHERHQTLADYIAAPGFYPAGRLDTDSEGLLLLTDDGALQTRIADPRHKLPKTYWVQVEGIPTQAQLDQLCRGVDLGDFTTLPAEARLLPEPDLWPRNPPIRVRKAIPDSWISLTIREGKNRQVRRMTAKVGLPTLRLVRVQVGEWRIDGIVPGEWQRLSVALPGRSSPTATQAKTPYHARGFGARK